jgi:agmatine deiminase
MNQTPKQLGYHFPAEFEPHEATWLSWPHKEASWPGKIQTIYKPYAEFITAVAEGEKVRINVNDEEMKWFAKHTLQGDEINHHQLEFFIHPTNDAWCRDHGPAFVINPEKKQKAIIDWGYNAWGNKYPPYDLDDVIPTLIGKRFNLPVFHPGIIMEGGSVEFNVKVNLLK